MALHKARHPDTILCIVFFFFFPVLPLYCYQPISLHPRAHMLSHVTPWSAARQAPLSMDFSRQEYWSGLPFPSPHPLHLIAIKLRRERREYEIGSDQVYNSQR